MRTVRNLAERSYCDPEFLHEFPQHRRATARWRSRTEHRDAPARLASARDDDVDIAAKRGQEAEQALHREAVEAVAGERRNLAGNRGQS